MGKTYTCEIQVRWADFDRLGHVNNTKYFEYAQEARLLFYSECIYASADLRRAVAVLRKTDMEFLVPVSRESGPLAIEVAVTHIGTSSYSIRHIMRDVRGRTCAVANAVMVGVDFKDQAVRPLKDDERNLLSEYLVEASAS